MAPRSFQAMKVLVGLLSLLLFLGVVLAPRDLAQTLRLPPALAAMLPQRPPAPAGTPTPTELTGPSAAPSTAAPVAPAATVEPATPQPATPKPAAPEPATPQPATTTPAPTPHPTPAPTPAATPTPTPTPTLTPTPTPAPASYTVSGRVTAKGTGVANVTVTFHDSATLAVVTTATTAGDGRYAVQLGNGSYKVHFSPPAPYKEEWFNNRKTASQATILTVSTSNKTGVNAKLEQ